MESVHDFTRDQIHEIELSVPVLQNSDIGGISASVLPLWSVWLSTIVLSIVFAIGLPLNALTVLIFVRWKKLRHLVNFVLLLDCLSHILLCLVGFPIHMVSVWSGSYVPEEMSSDWLSLDSLQQVVRNFANLYGTFLSLSIAILRYRRLCWKKKDKFCTWNALKWSLSSGVPALGLTLSQSWTALQLRTLSARQETPGVEANSDFHQGKALDLDETERLARFLFTLKVALILISMLVIFFSYIRVSQRVWANRASQEKVMDPTKLRKSRSVHLRATIHSCVQILLILLTITPHLYEEVRQVLHFSAQHHPPPATTQGHTTIDQPRSSHLIRLLGLTLNYTLLVLGTPIAYIASCHRFREQFTSLLFGNMSYSRQLLRKLSPSGGKTRQLVAHAQRTAGTRHLVTNHNNNHIGHRLINIKARPATANLLASNARKVSGTNSTRSSSINSSSTGSQRTRLGFRSERTTHQNHLQTVTKATSDIISTLSLHHFQQAKLVLEPISQSTSSSGSSMDSGFTTKSKAPMTRGFSLDHDNSIGTPKKFCKQMSHDCSVRSGPLTSTSSAGSGSTGSNYYKYPQLISYCHSPTGSVSEIYGHKV